jgi:hypothetical protein
MTATVITPQTIIAPFGPTSGSAGAHDFTFAASTAATTDAWTCNGADILIAYHSGSAGAHTLTIASQDDEKNRSENITDYSMAAGDFAQFGCGLTNSKGWKDSSGKITVTTSDAEIKLAVLRLPAGYPS